MKMKGIFFKKQLKDVILWTKVRNLLCLGVILAGSSACSVQSFYQQKSVLSSIQPGMTHEQVASTLGEPDFRRFDSRSEEWEYRKWLSSTDAVVIVTFEGGKVIALDSFERPQLLPSVCPSGQHLHSSSSPTYLPVMNASEFSRFYEEVKAEAFTSDRYSRIQALAKTRSLTCRQCALLLKFYSFSNDKMDVLRLFAPHLVDREHYPEIQKEFPFSFDKEEVKKMLGF